MLLEEVAGAERSKDAEIMSTHAVTPQQHTLVSQAVVRVVGSVLTVLLRPSARVRSFQPTLVFVALLQPNFVRRKSRLSLVRWRRWCPADRTLSSSSSCCSTGSVLLTYTNSHERSPQSREKHDTRKPSHQKGPDPKICADVIEPASLAFRMLPWR